MNTQVNLFRVNDDWYYLTCDNRTMRGPFTTLQEASEALTYELEDERGKKKASGWAACED
jgi:hypothetical protein